MSVDTVLVVGSTGTQGGAVAHHLLADGIEVLALTREATSERARALADAGASVVEGTLEEPQTFRDHAEAADGVFLMTNFWEHGYDAEVEQGVGTVDLLTEVGVDHLVFAIAGAPNRRLETMRLLATEVLSAAHTEG